MIEIYLDFKSCFVKKKDLDSLQKVEKGWKDAEGQ